MRSILRLSAICLSSVFLMLVSLPAAAAYVAFPEAVGTYQGNFSVTDCAGTDQGSFTIYINADGTLTVDSIDTNGNAEILTGGILSVTSPAFTAEIFGAEHGIGGVTDIISLTGNATFDTAGNMTSASASASTYWDDPFGPPCLGTGSISFSRTVGGAEAINPAVTASSEVINDVNTLNQFVHTFTDSMGTRIQSALSGSMGGLKKLHRNGAMVEAQIGLSAGDDFEPVLVGVWGSFSHTRFENDFVRTKYDGTRNMFMGGLDFSPNDDTVIGVAFGYEKADIDTDFNGGAADSDGYTIAPYLGMVINDTWNFDISAGYSNLDTDQYRIQTGTRITSDVDTSRWFFSGNLNGFTQRGNWLLTGRIGAMYATSKDDEFTESNSLTTVGRTHKLGQFNLGGEAAYQMGDMEPFIGATYSYDMTATELDLLGSPQPSNDRTDFLLTGGLRFFSKTGMSGAVELSKRLGREDYSETTVNLNLRWDM